MIWGDKFFELMEKSEESAWNYATALRGCDIPSAGGMYDIKLFYTAPLRGRISKGLSQGETLIRCEAVRTERGLINLIEDLSQEVTKASRHYMFHVALGYKALGQEKISKAITKASWNGDSKDKYIWEVVWRVNNYVRKSLKGKGF